MKKSVLFLVSLFVVTTMVAAPVCQQRAMQVAQQFIPVPDAQAQAPAMREEELPADIVYTHPMPKSGQPAFYVVNVGGSFVIVSADDVAHQVLGYNLGKSWPVAANGEIQLPPQVKGFFDDLAAQMEAAIEANPNHTPDAEWSQPQSAPRRRMMSEMPDSVGPLLTTTWDQGQYYNALCPEDQNGPDGHCMTGCVATAMAQIINYWGNQVHTRGVHSYETNYGTLEVNYDSAHYDFAHMPAQLTSTSTPQEIQAVATLMRDCGIAADMDYGLSESSAYLSGARAGLINFFCYSPNLSMAERVVFTDASWKEMLRSEIALNRPFLYSGRNIGGHLFVGDGYKSGDFFHFNFGWSGSGDGWYLLDAVTPNSWNFNYDQTALLGIFPDSTSNVVVATLAGINSFNLDNPMYYYGHLGNNKYIGLSHVGEPVKPKSVTQFVSQDTMGLVGIDILSFESNNLLFYNGLSSNQLDISTFWSDTTLNDTLRFLCGGYVENNTSPVVSTVNSVSLSYYGNLVYGMDIELRISPSIGLFVPSNICCLYTDSGMIVSWREYGEATSWQIEYGLQGFEQGSGTIIDCTTTEVTIPNLENTKKYDFYVRAIGDNGEQSDWSRKVTNMAALFWQDVVTEMPNDFYTDGNGTYQILSPEGLAWWAKIGAPGSAALCNDIDMGANRWKPISNLFGTFRGCYHKISNIHVYEPQKQSGFGVGLFGGVTDGQVENLIVEKPQIVGRITGGIAGYSTRTKIINCAVIEGDIEGTCTGGLVGWNSDSAIVNCYMTGRVAHRIELGSDGGIGGICGTMSDGPIINCYSTSQLFNYTTLSEKGIIAGRVDYISDVSHSYYSPQDNLSAVGDDSWNNNLNDSVFQNVSAFMKNQDILILTNRVLIDSVYYNDLVSALNAWVDENNSDSIYSHWVADTAMVNGGYPIFAPMPAEPVGPITEIDNYKETNQPARKVFERGHLYILLPNGTRYDATGRKVE